MSEKKEKDFWDILSSLTPLILGVAITGVGGVFTHLYNARQLESNQLQNERQLQLNQIEALDKLRPLLTSTSPQDREFAYSSFVLLGYEKVVLKMISSSQDSSGEAIAQTLLESPDEMVRESAKETLRILSSRRRSPVPVATPTVADTTKAQTSSVPPRTAASARGARLINRFETGNPDEAPSLPDRSREAASLADRFGVKTELGRTIIEDSMMSAGPRNADSFAATADKAMPTNLKKGGSEKAWLAAFLEARRAKLPARYRNNRALNGRIDYLASLVAKEDWEMKTVPAAPLPTPSKSPAPAPSRSATPK